MPDPPVKWVPSPLKRVSLPTAERVVRDARGPLRVMTRRHAPGRASPRRDTSVPPSPPAKSPPAVTPSRLGIGVLFDRMHDAVLVLDRRTGAIVLCNAAAERW